MKDVLDFKDIRGALEILLHPVIQTFLEIKWRHIRKVCTKLRSSSSSFFLLA